MELSRILIQELKDFQVIELREVAEAAPGDDPDPEGTKAGTVSQVENGRSFPIVIGLPEAQAIERRLKGVVIKRPQTHDLLANVITALGGVLESITINDLSESTFFAQLNVKTGGAAGKVIHIDSRPSDAIALGIAGNVPIYVAEHVLDAAQKPDDEDK
jgi:bifunctional DNase/RNase